MGKLALFGIIFAENRRVYFPGNIVVGQLMAQLNRPMDMKVIKLKFVGEAYVHWTEEHSTGSGKDSKTETQHYSGREKLFEQTIYLQGKGSANGSKSLAQGRHILPFQFQLPSPLPTSYEDHIGHIRYYVKGTIVKPWKFDHNTKAVFTVLDMLDLNTFPNMIVPAGASGSKTLCCLCCKSAPIEVEFHSDRCGYVPGEYIIINATLTNGSNSKVKSTSAHLVQRVTYHATSKSKVVSRNVASMNGPGCDKHKSVAWTNEKLHIPPLPPSESNHCRIIDIAYSVIFQAHLRSLAVDMREQAPITIGTVPLQSLPMYNNLPETTELAPPAAMPSAPPAAGFAPPPPLATSTAPTPAYFAPPPSYADATDGGVNIKDEDDNEYTMGDMTYTPQYTYYDWNQSAFSYNK